MKHALKECGRPAHGTPRPRAHSNLKENVGDPPAAHPQPHASAKIKEHEGESPSLLSLTLLHVYLTATLSAYARAK